MVVWRVASPTECCRSFARKWPRAIYRGTYDPALVDSDNVVKLSQERRGHLMSGLVKRS